MIKKDKRTYSICIVSKSEKDIHYKHLDPKNKNEDILKEDCGIEKAIKEAQRLANRTNKKVTVLTSVYNVYPDKNKKEESS